MYEQEEKDKRMQESGEPKKGQSQTWKEAYPNQMPELSELPSYAYDKLKKYLKGEK